MTEQINPVSKTLKPALWFFLNGLGLFGFLVVVASILWLPLSSIVLRHHKISDSFTFDFLFVTLLFCTIFSLAPYIIMYILGNLGAYFMKGTKDFKNFSYNRVIFLAFVIAALDIIGFITIFIAYSYAPSEFNLIRFRNVYLMTAFLMAAVSWAITFLAVKLKSGSVTNSKFLRLVCGTNAAPVLLLSYGMMTFSTMMIMLR